GKNKISSNHCLRIWPDSCGCFISKYFFHHLSHLVLYYFLLVYQYLMCTFNVAEMLTRHLLLILLSKLLFISHHISCIVYISITSIKFFSFFTKACIL